MKTFIFKQLAALLLAFACMPFTAGAYTTITSPTTISVQYNAYVNNMNQEWLVNLGINKCVKLTYNLNLQPDYDYIHLLIGNEYGDFITPQLYTLTGTTSGTIYFPEMTGIVYIYFHTNDNICYADGYQSFTGFTMSISVDDRLSSTNGIIATGQNYLGGQTVVGAPLSYVPRPLYQPFNVYGSSFFKGGIGIYNTAPSQALDVTGKVAIAQSSAASTETYQGNLMITKSAATGQYINLSRYGNYTWSIGTVYNTNKFAIGQGKTTDSQFTSPFFTITPEGNVGINTANPQNKLDVKGTIRAVALNIEPIEEFADFVFDKSYQLPRLTDVNRFIQDNGHLPNIPSAIEVKENGLNVADMQIKLLQKIEELTLYLIQQQETIDKLNLKIEQLENK